MIHRQNNVLKTSGSDPAFAASYTVNVLPVGAVAASASSGSTATVDSGHGFAAGDKVLIWDGTTATFVAEALNSVTGTTLVWSSATPTIAKGNLLCNLGPDTGSGATVNWDGFDGEEFIFSDANGGDQITSCEVTTDTTGNYDYWIRGDGRCWEVIRDSGGTVASVIPGWGGVAGRLSTGDFGMVGNGSVNDSPRCKVWLDAAAQLGATAWAAGGSYLMSEKCLMVSNSRLRGDGSGIFVRNYSQLGEDNAVFYSGSAGVTDVDWQGIRFKVNGTDDYGDMITAKVTDSIFSDIVVESWGDNAGTGGAALKFVAYNSIFNNLHVSGALNKTTGVSCLRILGGDNISVSNCYFDSGDDCVQISQSTSGNWAGTDATNIVMQNIAGASAAARLIAVLCYSTGSIKNVSISDVHGSGEQMIRVDKDASGTGTIDGVYINNVSGTHTGDSTSENCIEVGNDAADDLVYNVHISNVRMVAAAADLGTTAGVVTFKDVNDCSLKNSYIDASAVTTASTTAAGVIVGNNADRIEIVGNRIVGNSAFEMIEGSASGGASSGWIVKDNLMSGLGSAITAISCSEGEKWYVEGNKCTAASAGTGTFFLDAAGTPQGNHVVVNNDVSDLATLATGSVTTLGSLYRNNKLLATGFTTGISAAGSSAADGTALTAHLNHVTTVGASQGVVLPSIKFGLEVQVHNAGANTLTVYGDSGGSTSFYSSGPSVTLAAGDGATFYASTGTTWMRV